MSSNEKRYSNIVLGSNVQRNRYWQSCYCNVKPLSLVSIIESRILYRNSVVRMSSPFHTSETSAKCLYVGDNDVRINVDTIKTTLC